MEIKQELRRHQERIKSNRFKLAKQNLARGRLFVHLFAVVAQPRRETA